MNTEQSPEAVSLSRIHNASIFILFVVSLAVFITAGDLVLDLFFNGVTVNPDKLVR